MDGDGHKKGTQKSIDFTKMSAYERQRIRDSWRASPIERLKFIKPPTPPEPRKTTYGFSAPALKAKCTPHTEMLAIAKYQAPQMHYVTKAEREAQKELEEEMTKEELRWLKRKYFTPAPSGVKKSALLAKITPRVEAMSLARLTILNDTKRTYFQKLNTNQKNALNRAIKEHHDMFNSNYPPESDKIYVLVKGTLVHPTCTGKEPLSAQALQGGKRRFRYICELNKNQRKNFRRRMKNMGLPKKAIVQDKGPDRGPKKKLKEFEPWITMMSQPRYNILNEKPYDPYKVKSSAKVYVATERIIQISKPIKPPPPPPLTDFEGNELPPRREWSFESRKRIVASQRTIELAVPRLSVKKKIVEVKKDPYAVPKRALTAFCSERTKELALPVMRRR